MYCSSKSFLRFLGCLVSLPTSMQHARITLMGPGYGPECTVLFLQKLPQVLGVSCLSANEQDAARVYFAGSWVRARVYCYSRSSLRSLGCHASLTTSKGYFAVMGQARASCSSLPQVLEFPNLIAKEHKDAAGSILPGPGSARWCTAPPDTLARVWDASAICWPCCNSPTSPCNK